MSHSVKKSFNICDTGMCFGQEKDSISRPPALESNGSQRQLNENQIPLEINPYIVNSFCPLYTYSMLGLYIEASTSRID